MAEIAVSLVQPNPSAKWQHVADALGLESFLNLMLNFCVW